MTVGELKEKLNGVDDSLKVIIPANMEFDGRFYSPCSKESGPSLMGSDPEVLESDDFVENYSPDEEVFLLIPCGFSEEKDCSYQMN